LAKGPNTTEWWFCLNILSLFLPFLVRYVSTNDGHITESNYLCVYTTFYQEFLDLLLLLAFFLESLMYPKNSAPSVWYAIAHIVVEEKKKERDLGLVAICSSRCYTLPQMKGSVKKEHRCYIQQIKFIFFRSIIYKNSFFFFKGGGGKSVHHFSLIGFFLTQKKNMYTNNSILIQCPFYLSLYI
jgi:hypothetical protein